MALSKIAIMMLVHKNKRQTQRLVDHLSKDFDVYVHIDLNSKIEIKETDNVFVYKKYKAYWGSLNIVIATLFLLKETYKKRYDRYLLISGQDLPLKTNEEIKIFFENNHNEYLNIVKIPTSGGWPNMDRITAYRIDDKYHNNKDKKLFRMFNRAVDRVLVKVSKIFPRKPNYNFYGGSQWTNYTHDCVEKILEYIERDRKYINRYRWTSCSDEVFFQTIIHQLNGINVVNDYLRYIDWESGPEYPKILREKDLEKMMSSGALFARKFDESIDKNVIENIYKRIGEV